MAPQVAGVYIKAWHYVSDSCLKAFTPQQPPLMVYLHVESRPLRCKDILRHGGGCELVRLDPVGLHPQGRALCQ